MSAGTDEYDYPSEDRGLLVFGIVQRSSLESFRCLHHKETCFILAAERVMIETLGPLNELLIDEERREDADARA
jgi:hypothetical protein